MPNTIDRWIAISTHSTQVQVMGYIFPTLIFFFQNSNFHWHIWIEREKFNENEYKQV